MLEELPALDQATDEPRPSVSQPTANHNGVFTLPDTDTDAETDTDAIGFETHCVGVSTSVGKGKICVGVGQCEHTTNRRGKTARGLHTLRKLNNNTTQSKVQ